MVRASIVNVKPLTAYPMETLAASKRIINGGSTLGGICPSTARDKSRPDPKRLGSLGVLGCRRGE